MIVPTAMLNVTGWPAAADVLAAHQLKNFRIRPKRLCNSSVPERPISC
jgi:hypothetical protein